MDRETRGRHRGRSEGNLSRTRDHYPSPNVERIRTQPRPYPPQVLKAVAQEGARLEQRQGRHKRQQKRAYARMVQGGREEGADASPVGGALRRCWRAAAGWAARGDRRGAMALVGAAAVAAFAAALLLAPRLVAALVAAPGDGAE